MEIKKSHDFIIEKIRNHVPLLRYDGKEDFATWKARAREKLNELLGLPLESCDDDFRILGEEDCGWYRKINFTFQSEPGYYVPCMFTIPHAVTSAAPLALCIQGHSSGMHNSLGIQKFPGDYIPLEADEAFALRAMKEGCCAVMLEQRYMGTCGQLEDEDVGGPLCARRNAALPSLLMGRTGIGERAWDAQRVLDVAFKHFAEYIDPSQVICVGNSGGGTTTLYVSSLDDRITLAIPSCYVCDFDFSIVPHHHCSCNYVPGIRKYFEMGDIASLNADRKLIIVCGKLDPEFPVEGSERSYQEAKAVFEATGREEYCHLVEGDGGHRFYENQAWAIANKIGYGK